MGGKILEKIAALNDLNKGLTRDEVVEKHDIPNASMLSKTPFGFPKTSTRQNTRQKSTHLRDTYMKKAQRDVTNMSIIPQG